jgi:hypothetical protein
MLDFNHRPSSADRVNAAVDRALTVDQAMRPRRDYLGGSRLGHACERVLQFEFTATPKDEGQEFTGQALRIFAIGYALEDLGVTSTPARATRPMAVSSASPSQAGASAVMSTASSPPDPKASGLLSQRSGNARR